MNNNKTVHVRNLILDSIPVAMVTMDAGFRITSFNNHAEHLTGFTASEAIGRPCHEILHSSKCDSQCPLQTIQEHRTPSTGLEAEFINRFHEHIPVRIGTAAIENEAGDFIGYLEVIEDISREKTLEREKNNFQFMIAHDMKSPLVAIKGLIKRIREHHDEMSAEKRDEYFRIISEAGEQLEAQVMEFLEFSRQATHQIKIHLEDTDLPALIDKLITRHQEQAAEKTLTISSKHAIAGLIKVDSKQMQRVFENLLDNSIKFAHQPGEIIITTRETDNEVLIQIKDNGPGIAAKELPYIFDAFHQSKSSNKGHGLGLAAVKAIVQQHGGRVAVKSNTGIGSEFTVRLPKIH